MFQNVIAISAVVLGLAACQQAPDLGAIQSERAKSVQRYDISQALAANGKVLVAGTQSGVLLVSADSGKTWKREPLGMASIIGLATCPDGSFVGIDFNHKVWSGDAQGANWKSVALDKPRTPLTVACDGKGQWWVAGSGAKIAKSADRGASWQLTDLNEDAQLTALQMVDGRFGIALGEFGMVVTTEDGGATWQKREPIPGDFYPYATLFLDRQSGYASSIAGQILKTNNGGKTWTKLENPTGASLYRLFRHDDKAYGAGSGGTVVRLDGDAVRPLLYPDAQPVFLGGAAALPGAKAIALGGPGGTLRVVSTSVN